ncbi:hypothetical protein Tdes44962_MAKER05625 [Teratosphaeria destructans]|uniref:Uncharacterized protein n=1 Tax=Teratosphaeria destructans TaxID=418781 RepID=A0A9W7VYY7_9PEZI|nr:hypothetical protein Tdes44962_MAKER05625 [Teratosphaeria destructans]
MALELRAEEMSQGGSDIGEEIRRMNEAERSRQNSIQSSHQGDSNGVRGGAGMVLANLRSRQSSAAGMGGSVVDVNANAPRYGGYGSSLVTSPTGSVRSGRSWSHASAAAARKASASGSSRLAQMVEPMQEGRPLDSPLAPSHSSLSRQPSQASQNSFVRRYDEIAGEIEEQLGKIEVGPSKRVSAVVEDPEYEEDARGRSPTWQLDRGVPVLRPRSVDTYQEAQAAFKDFDGVHFEPETDEYVETDERGNEVWRVSARSTSGGALSADAVPMLRSARVRPMSYAPPPPGDGMVYYPAPVPRMLNLPKRLSQLPSASVQAQRRSQLLGQLGPEARQSAPWLPQVTLSDAQGSHRSHHSMTSVNHEPSDHPTPFLNERMSMANFQNLPPQLRASVFFDHQTVQQAVEIKSESAVATLDSILAASATAPVSAFTDHPFAGDVRRSVYAPEIFNGRRSTASLGTTVAVDSESPKKTKKRRSIVDLLRRSSTADLLGDEATKNPSRPSNAMMDFNQGGKKLQKWKSVMSLGSIGDELDRQAAEPVRTPGREIDEADASGVLIDQAQDATLSENDDGMQRSRPSTAMSKLKSRVLSENDQIEEDFKETEEGDDEEGEPIYAAPTTLLAELQIRKMNLKSRNRTAATAFPNGMHSTLLELDAVEQIKQKKRRGHRVPLAWEDPAQQQPEEDSDDEVPLGLLFPAKGGLVPGTKRMGDGKDWDRPLGLMEKRELEDNEPLASRRNRLLGLPPDYGRQQNVLPNASQMHLAGQPDADEAELEEEDEHADETLAQRMRRLRTKNELDGALEGLENVESQSKVKSRPVSTFTDELLGRFGGDGDAENKQAGDGASTSPQPAPETAATADPIDEEEETLGQRRARLQREREACGATTTARPPALRSISSFGNLLATNPIAPATPCPLRTATFLPPARCCTPLYQTNVRSSSYGGPMMSQVQSQPVARQPSYSGLLAERPAGMAPSGGFAGGMYNDGLGGAQLPTSSSTPAMPYGGQRQPSSYFPPQPQAYQPATYQPAGGFQPPQPPRMPGYMYPPMGQMGVPYGYAGQMQMMPQQPQGLARTMGMPGVMGNGSAMWMGTAAVEAKQRDAIDRWRMSVHM